MASFKFSAFADEAGSSLDKQIAALQRNRIGYIEPRNVDGGILSKSVEELKEIRRRLDDAGIATYSLGSPIGKYPIHDDFEPHRKDFIKALDTAEILGASRIRMFSFFVEQNELSECRDEVLRRLEYMLDEAEKRGILLCHENESRIYGQMPNEVKDLLTALPRLRGIFDPCNYIMNNASTLEGLETTLPSFEYMHIKDGNYADHSIVPAGEGDGKIPEAIERVDALTDRCITLTIEPHLRVFDAYKSIDSRELKNKRVFASSDEAFDCACSSLSKVMTDLGFRLGDDLVWSR